MHINDSPIIEHTFWGVESKASCEWLLLDAMQSLPFTVQPLFLDIALCNFGIMHFQQVQKDQTRHLLVWLCAHHIVLNFTMIHYNAKQPMHGLIAWNRNEFLFENINVILGCPACHRLWSMSGQVQEKM
jgi:hypothetical protein